MEFADSGDNLLGRREERKASPPPGAAAAVPLNGYAAHLWSNEEEYLKVLTKKYQEAVGTNK